MPESPEFISNQRRFWDAESDAFDSIYSGNRSWLGRFLDRTFREDIYERYEFTLEHSQPLKGATVLDIGCGSGRFCVAMAQRGAQRVYGVDIAASMLDLGREAAQRANVADNVEWILGDINAYSGEPVDVTLGIGLFDYVSDPVTLLRQMGGVTRGKVIASFPRSNTWRAPVRKIRLALRGCPVFFYSKSGLIDLLENAQLRPLVFEQVGKLYCVVAEPMRPQAPS